MVTFLNASWDDIGYLELKDATSDEVETVVKKRTEITPKQIQSDNNEMADLIDQLWNDESLRKAFLVFWAGWKARSE